MKDYQCLKGMIEDSKSKLMTAYDKGYKKALEDDADIVRENRSALETMAYERGAKDMFDAIFKVLSTPKDGGYLYTQLEEIFSSSNEFEIVDSFKENPLLLIEKIRECEEQKQESQLHCHYLDRACPYDSHCITCDLNKAIKAAMEKAKENESDT